MNNAFSWLLDAYPDSIFTAFDTETTGLEPAAGCRVIEIGGISFDSHGIRARFNSLINPGISVPAEVTAINAITTQMLQGQPEPRSVYTDFLHFSENSILIAHNAPFDIKFVNMELGLCQLPPLQNQIVDTLALARIIFPGRKTYRLQDLARDFGIVAINAHRAEDDARVCMDFFLFCLKAMYEEKLSSRQE